MSESYSEMLRSNYEKMHSDILIETKLKGGLTDVAKRILEEELQKRKINETEINEYIDSDADSVHPDDFADGITLGKLATTGSRYIAQIVDQAIGFCVFLLAAFVIRLLEIKGGFALGLGILSYASYILMNDAMPNGQSLGKKLLGIKVIDKHSGNNCTLKESFIRNITTVIPFLAVIDALMIFGKKKQRLGDIMADTLVIKA